MKTEIEFNLTVIMTITNDSIERNGDQLIEKVAKQISEYAQSHLEDTAVSKIAGLKTLAVHNMTVKDVDTDDLNIATSGTYLNESTEALTKEKEVLIDAITGKKTKIYEETGEAKLTQSLIEMNEEKIKILRRKLADI